MTKRQQKAIYIALGVIGLGILFSIVLLHEKGKTYDKANIIGIISILLLSLSSLIQGVMIKP